MKKIRTVIVEDCGQARFLLNEELSRYKNLEIISEYENGLKGLNGINELKPDLVFVDIDMPVMDGFQMLQRLQYEPAIIFCTGYQEFALRAWDYNAADFITKPLESLRIKKALEKALSDIENRRQTARISYQREQAGLEHVTWINRYNEKISRFFSADDIIFIKSDADYVNFFLVREVAEELEISSSITLKMTIKKVVEIWQKYGFRRAHRGYVVNLDKIISWNKSKMTLRLKDVEEAIPVGRVYMDNFTSVR